MESAIDVDSLFKTFTVTEVDGIEKKLKSDVERKKEDLRQMVGRRYRDIIDAADSIKTMKETSNSILGSIKEAQVKVSGVTKTQHISKRPPRNFAYSSHSEADTWLCGAKFLGDITEIVFDFADKGELLFAAYCFRLAEHVFARLESKCPSSEYSQWLVKKFAFVKATKCSVVNGWKDAARIEGSVEKLRDIFAAIAIIEAVSTSELCQRFLDLRLGAISSALFNNDDTNKQQISKALDIWLSTFVLGAAVFVHKQGADKDSSLHAHISTVLSNNFKTDVLREYIRRQDRFVTTLINDLIQDVSSASIIDLAKFGTFTPEALHACFKTFLENTVQLFASRVSDCLNSIDSISTLSKLKRSFVDQLGKVVDGESSKWTLASTSLLGSIVSPWDVLLQREFDKRLEVLVGTFIEQTATDFIADVGENCATLDLQSGTDTSSADYATFLWNEVPTDVVSDDGESEHSTLKVKAHAYNLHVHRLCDTVNVKLKQLKEDLEAYVNIGQPSATIGDEIWLHSAAVSWRNECCERLTAMTARSVEDLQRMCIGDEIDADIKCKRLVFGAKVCSSLCENCSALAWFFEAGPTVSRSRVSPEKWNAVSANFMLAAENLLTIWSRTVVDQAGKRFSVALMNMGDAGWLENMHEWDVVEVVSDSDNASEKSEFLLPFWLSPLVETFLNDICLALHSVGAFVLSRSVMDMVAACCCSTLSGFLRDYLNAMNSENPLSAKLALQVVFDLNVVQLLFGGKATPTRVTSSDAEQQENVLFGILERFEALADPFDLDMLYAHNKRHVQQRFVQKCFSLYGCLLPHDVYSGLCRYPAAGKATSATERSQLFHLNSSVKRFQLLPITSDAKLAGNSSNGKSHAVYSPAVHTAVSGTTLGSTGSLASTLMQKSASFYDRISSNLFAV